MTDRPVLTIQWDSAGTAEQDRALGHELAHYAMVLLNGYRPSVTGMLRPDAKEEGTVTQGDG